MPLFFGDKPEFKLTAKLRKEGAKFKPLFKAVRRLKSQFGLDAKGISLKIDTDRTDLADNVAGSFDPNENLITLSLSTAESLAARNPIHKIRTPMTRGRDAMSLLQSVLRHEFSHAMQLNREARTGQEDTSIDRSGERVYGGQPPHGETFNRLNVAVQGSGSEVDTPHIGLPPELLRMISLRRDF